MTIELTAYRWVPPFAQGYVKDLRVRWALEEASLPYQVLLIGPPRQPADDRAPHHPFGQVPALRDGAVEMFESGAIVLYLAARSDRLSPPDEISRARVTSWVFAAVTTIDPLVQMLNNADDLTRETCQAALDRRLSQLATWLGDADYLEGRFTAGDLMMTMVLREAVDNGTLASFPKLDAYRRRCEARPAFAKALADQLATFIAHAPAERAG